MTAETRAAHGTNARYVLLCRCFECRVAHALYQADYRARRVAEGSQRRTVSVYLDCVEVGRVSEVRG